MIKIESIQPSQLFISKAKLIAIEKSTRDLDPIPIKKIGNICFATDGHTRLLSYFNKGLKEIKVRAEGDELDWMAYLVCVHWCRTGGIFSAADLADRVVSAKEYEQLWLQRCKEMHRHLGKDYCSYLSFQEIKEPTYKSEICENILRSLPEWFGLEEANRNYIEGVKGEIFFAAEVGRIAIGFITLKQTGNASAEIGVMGIYPEFHNRGIGKKMVQRATLYLREKDVKYLFVRTLSSKRGDKHYDATRNFYLACGFEAYKELPHYWSLENPCLLMRKKVDV